MRISKEAAAANKAHILQAASQLLLEKGLSGLGVSEVMQQAGLTHGGFYNHFESKDALAVAALGASFDGAVERVAKRAAQASTASDRKSVFRFYIDRYLSKGTRDAQNLQCPMAAVGTDVAQGSEGMKTAFAEGVKRYLLAFTNVIPGKANAARKRAEAITALSTMIGALTLARACAGTNDDLSDEILAAVREKLVRET
jgi:TetR/AcrR family transcriptional repressor of nem operon